MNATRVGRSTVKVPVPSENSPSSLKFVHKIQRLTRARIGFIWNKFCAKVSRLLLKGMTCDHIKLSVITYDLFTLVIMTIL